MPNLQELDCSVWEGLPFDEIRKKYPELYDKRGADPLRFVPEHGEYFPDALLRFRSAVEQIKKESSGEIAIVEALSFHKSQQDQAFAALVRVQQLLTAI